MPSLASVPNGTYSPHNGVPKIPNAMSTMPSAPILGENGPRLEKQLASATSALNAANAEISQLNQERQALLSDNSKVREENSALKRRYDEFVAGSSQTLKAQQEALMKAHAEEISQLRAQMNQQHQEMGRTMDQLKREKAEMQGVVHLLQQQVAASSSHPNPAQLEEEKVINAKLHAKIQELTVQLQEATLKASTTEQNLTPPHVVQSNVTPAELHDLKEKHRLELVKRDEAEQHLRQRLAESEENNRKALAELSSPSDQEEIEKLRSQLREASQSLEQSRITSEEHKRSAEDLQTQLAEKEESLRRASEQTKTLQSQTSANFAQVEQMKQQVLRDRAELSKKLSMIAPETVRKVEQLMAERDAINSQFEEVTRSLAEVSKQKIDILSKLSQETSRNSLLTKQNSELKHQLSLQLTALGLPHDAHQTVPEFSNALEGPSTVASRQTGEKGTLHDHTNNTTVDQAQTSANEAASSNTSTENGNLKPASAKLPPRRKRNTSKPKNAETIHSDANASLNPPGGNPQPTAEQKKSGWLSSVPLVSRLWNGQQPVAHSAHVQI